MLFLNQLIVYQSFYGALLAFSFFFFFKEKFYVSHRGEGGGVLPFKGLMGTCGQPGYVFRDFCLKQGIKVIIFCLNQGIDLSIFVLNRMSFLGR